MNIELKLVRPRYQEKLKMMDLKLFRLQDSQEDYTTEKSTKGHLRTL